MLNYRPVIVIVQAGMMHSKPLLDTTAHMLYCMYIKCMNKNNLKEIIICGHF